ncbi:hypothetical protein J6590_018223 [Homalodisca vitripennis]|nr:hypothetical protein J6590_018223 [Homalodisca vitripennis]
MRVPVSEVEDANERLEGPRCTSGRGRRGAAGHVHGNEPRIIIPLIIGVHVTRPHTATTITTQCRQAPGRDKEILCEISGQLSLCQPPGLLN